MYRFIERECISLLMMRVWNDRIRSHNDIAALFNATFQNKGRAILMLNVVKRVKRFEETGSANDRLKFRRPICQ